jgi:hypothetical protein
VASFGDPSWFLSLFSFVKTNLRRCVAKMLSTYTLRKYGILVYFWATFSIGVRVVICLMRCFSIGSRAYIGVFGLECCRYFRFTPC